MINSLKRCKACNVGPTPGLTKYVIHLVLLCVFVQTFFDGEYMISRSAKNSNWVKLKAGLPVVLKFLKFHRCPEIVLKSAIVLKFYSFG